MKVFGQGLGNKYVLVLVAAASIYAGGALEKIGRKADIPGQEFPYEMRSGKVEFKSRGGVKHSLHARGIFRNNDKPMMAYLYETKEKMTSGDWDMIVVSPFDDGSYPVKDTRGKSCLGCHSYNGRGVDV